mmetsp:Transcript_17409/g.29782  ORF Transcript_17409/g.29782 Transcript_17409/m.29782 type:complete len:211 (-) Transcript_17409:299-931(-)
MRRYPQCECRMHEHAHTGPHRRAEEGGGRGTAGCNHRRVMCVLVPEGSSPQCGRYFTLLVGRRRETREAPGLRFALHYYRRRRLALQTVNRPWLCMRTSRYPPCSSNTQPTGTCSCATTHSTPVLGLRRRAAPSTSASSTDSESSSPACTGGLLTIASRSGMRCNFPLSAAGPSAAQAGGEAFSTAPPTFSAAKRRSSTRSSTPLQQSLQ